MKLSNDMSLDQFRDEKVHLAVVAGIEGVNKIAVVEAGDVLNFTAEGRFGLRVGASPRQHLDRHNAAHQQMLGLEHLPHSPLPHCIENAVLSKGQFPFAGQQLIGLKSCQRAAVHEYRPQYVVIRFGG